jgi:hypothetical protein
MKRWVQCVAVFKRLSAHFRLRKGFGGQGSVRHPKYLEVLRWSLFASLKELHALLYFGSTDVPGVAILYELPLNFPQKHFFFPQNHTNLPLPN